MGIKALPGSTRHRMFDVDPVTKIGRCSRCGSGQQAYVRAEYKGRPQWSCANQVKTSAQERYYRNQDRIRDQQFQAKFGITLAEYEAMLAAQDGLCARCDEPPTKLRLAVDHCHKTGAVRMLLCGSCNTYLGRLEANVGRLESDLRYLATGSFASPIAAAL